jgi:Siphovirus Gp157
MILKRSRMINYRIMEVKMTSNFLLNRYTTEYLHLRDRMLEEWPDLDDETLVDTLEGITDLHEMIAEVVRSALADQAMAAGLKLRLDEMKSRLARLEERGRKKRQLALDALVEADIKKLMQPDLTVSVRPGTQALVVTSEDNIPEDFWFPQPPKLDRQGVLAALKSGKIIEGAALNNPAPTISVRTK